MMAKLHDVKSYANAERAVAMYFMTFFEELCNPGHFWDMETKPDLRHVSDGVILLHRM